MREPEVRPRQRTASRNACRDWTEWATRPDAHGPYHYWRWNPSGAARGRERLGQRIYTIVCLLWSALHDRIVGEGLRARHPNWRAIASYYSMVHSVRLVWFVLYGGYPKGHSQLGAAMSGDGAARADWSHGDLRAGRAPIHCDALRGALQIGLKREDLAQRLNSIGQLFSAAVRLRNDANYESLVLAHQYNHRGEMVHPDPVRADEQMTGAVTAFASAREIVLAFLADVLRAAFDDEAECFCPREVYSGQALRRLVVNRIEDLIARVYIAQEQDVELDCWWPKSFQCFRDVSPAPISAQELVDHFSFDSFDVKRTIMQEFRDNVDELTRRVQDATHG